MTYIRQDDYSQMRHRPNLLTNYLHQMTTFLRLKYPNCSEEEIEGFIKATVAQRFKPPTVEALVHPREGETKEVTMRLDHYVKEIIADNNLAPSGTCYHPVSRKESFLRVSIDDKVKERNDFKKKYLNFEAQGAKREAQYYYQNQANAKIFNNAIAGGMGTKQFILGDKAGFNSITSVGRMCVKQGYSFIERAIVGNIYLPSVRDAITYALNHIRHIPVDFIPLIDNNELYQPTVKEVVVYLLTSVRNYTNQLKADHLIDIITNMTIVERSYVFYAGCLNNLCRYNETMMKTWIDSCFIDGPIDASLYTDINPVELKSFPGDVVNAVLATDYRRLGKKPGSETKWNSLKDAAENNPDGLKEFIYCCRHFVHHFKPQLRILKPIMKIETTFARLIFQDRMARYTVPLSDTDSNIFSTQELIKWKRGKIDFSQESYRMNAIVVFLMSQTLEHVFARLSAGFGIENQDIFRISMKNEFLYPVVIVTALAKHYIAIATMQEGSLLPTPRKDIKGVGLRSSTYPKIIRDTFEQFCVDLIDEVMKGEPIKSSYIFDHIFNLEQTIYTSVTNKESLYLQTKTIRRKEDYAEPMKTSYFGYELWQNVFAEEYGEMTLPNKCFKIPLKGGKKFFKNEALLEKLKETHPIIHRNLMAFREKHAGRDITAILIPPFKGPVNPLFLAMMDIRAHISEIMMGYYHLLNALGVGTPNPNNNGLVSDFYDPSSQLLD